MRMQKTIITVVSAAASLMLIAGTLMPVAYGAGAITGASSCTVRGAITADQATKLAPGDTNVQNGVAAGVNLYDPSSANPGGTAIATTNWGILCTFGIIQQISNILFLVVGILSVVGIVLAAFFFITGGAVPDHIKKAQNALIFSIVGILVAVAAYLIPSIALALMGVH